VLQTHAAFKSAIRARRADVKDEAMEGQWYDGVEALAFGVVDQVTTASLDEYVTALIR
jgi:enoyl-CoA hydratase/carnithine racemase